MNSAQTIFRNIAIFIVFVIPFISLAAPLYQPGETLNPACLPTDADCTVATTTSSTSFSTTTNDYWLTQQFSLSNLAGIGSSTGTTFLNGNVGIGTSTSGQYNLLLARATGSATANIQTSDAAGEAAINLENTVRRWKIKATAAASDAFVIRDQTAAADRFVINNVGNVGIGTTSAYAKLSVGSTDTASTTFALRPISSQTANILDIYNTSGALTSVITAAGNWGIGTSSPAVRLQIGSGYANFDNSYGLTFANAGATDRDIARILYSPSGTLDFYNADAVRMTVGYGGNIGIGTTSPYTKLSVVGDIVATAITATSSFNTSGTTGGYKIDGNLILQASSTNSSLTIGQSAGAALLADGIGNTAIGFEALKVATSSDHNTAVGYRALYSNTTGVNNAANGSYSLYTNTTGASNTANGYGALYSNATGSNNVASGYASLYSNTTGSNNVANGNVSLYSNTTGSNNSASGFFSLYYNTTGNQNSALGRGSLQANTTGSNNTATGYTSLYSNITGAQNTASGMYSLYYGTSTTYSTAIGYLSGVGSALAVNDYNSAVDTYMTFIGSSASRDSNVASTTALINSTAIGYNAKVGGSNMLVLGNGVNVGIGTTSPLAKLSVTNTGTGPSFIVEDSTSPDTSPFVIDASGNVGIGTSTPSTKLSIEDSVAPALVLSNTDTNISSGGVGETIGQLDFWTKDGSYATGGIAGRLDVTDENLGSAAAMRFFTTAQGTFSEKMRISSAGNVGIGTTTPNRTLEVYDDTTGIARISGGSNTSPARRAILEFVSQDTNRAQGALTISSGSEGWFFGKGYAMSGFTIGYGTSQSEYLANSKLFVSTAGNVGIGTSSPLAKLDVLNTSGGSTALFSIASSTSGAGTTTALYVTGNGNVGIGTTSFSSKFALAGGSFIHTATGTPVLAGTYSTSGVAFKVQVSGKHAYVADGSGGLQIIDISNPSSPSLMGTYDTSGNAYEVQVSGKYAYVADGSVGLQIIDISNPNTPTLASTLSIGDFALGVYVSGKYAYIAGYSSGLQVVNISNPAAPSVVGTYNTSGGATDVYVSGKYAYVADGSAGLQVIDISNPASPAFVGTYNTSGTATSLYVSGKYAYVADWSAGMHIINISNPASPSFVATYATSANAEDVYVSGKYAYVADESYGLRVVDISNPSVPRVVGTYDTNGSAYGVYVSGKYAYVADFSSGFKVIDINGIETPALYAGNINTSDLTVSENTDIGNNLYVRNGLNVGMGGLFSDGVLTLAGTSSSYFAGNVGISTTTPSARLSVTQSANTSAGGLWIAETGNTDFRSIYMATDGTMSFYGGDTSGALNTATLNSSGAWTNASDKSYKENIVDLGTKYGLASVLASTPRFYEMKGNHVPQVGFIAQELEAIIPEVVDGKEGSKGISYGNLVAVAFQAIKELNTKVENMFKSLFVKELHIEEKLCVEEVCIDKEQLKKLLLKAGAEEVKETPKENNKPKEESPKPQENATTTAATTPEVVTPPVATSTPEVIKEEPKEEVKEETASSTPETVVEEPEKEEEKPKVEEPPKEEVKEEIKPVEEPKKEEPKVEEEKKEEPKSEEAPQS